MLCDSPLFVGDQNAESSCINRRMGAVRTPTAEQGSVSYNIALDDARSPIERNYVATSQSLNDPKPNLPAKLFVRNPAPIA